MLGPGATIFDIAIWGFATRQYNLELQVSCGRRSGHLQASIPCILLHPMTLMALD